MVHHPYTWSELRCDISGNVALIFALAAVPLVLCAGTALDFSRQYSLRSALQVALDGAALAVAKDAATMNNRQLQTAADTYFSVNFRYPNADSVTLKPSYDAKQATVTIAGTTSLPAEFVRIVGIWDLPVSTSVTVSVDSPRTIAVDLVFDTSASMIVGASSKDVSRISKWVSKNWDLVKPGDPAPNYPTGDNPPCAFACHDIGGATTRADIALGLTHAHAAGATTRFDVMTAAGSQLISHIQNELSKNPALSKNVFVFNVFSFDNALRQSGSQNMALPDAVSALQSLSPGLDTHLSDVMANLITKVGKQGDGSSTSKPLKFVILITDGLQSDRSANWSGGHWAWDSAWSYNTHFDGYDTTIDLRQCDQIKSNGVIFATLETPYVPLTGQSPNVAPYEKTVRKVIYPNGPGTASAVSSALASCASPGYYFQASKASDIATGFVTLTDKFLSENSMPYIQR